MTQHDTTAWLRSHDFYSCQVFPLTYHDLNDSIKLTYSCCIPTAALFMGVPECFAPNFVAEKYMLLLLLFTTQVITVP